MATTAIIERIDRKFDFGTDEVTGLPSIYVFDAVINEHHAFDVAITENPVETGVSLADHAYNKPDILTMEVAVSDTPLISDDSGTPSYKLATTWTEAGEGNVRRSINAWKFIIDRAKSFAIFDVQTGLRLYQNMMFENGSAEQAKDSCGVMRAKIQLHQVTFATTQTVLFSPRATKAVDRKAAPKVTKGKEEAEEPPEDIKKTTKSSLSSITGKGK
jgi:hypothetical protein